jgi:chromosome segregation ATPase
MKCCKKTLVLAAVLAGGVAIVATTGLGRHAIHKVAEWGKRQIPLEDQLEAVKIDISRIEKDIDSGWPKIARYETEIKDLQKDLEGKQARLTRMQPELATATDELEKQAKFVTYNNQKYSPAQAGKLLDGELRVFVALKREVAAKTQLLAARQQKLAAAMSHQNEMKAQRNRLNAEVEQLQADLETLRLQQAESKLPTGNDSRLDNIKEKVRALKTQIDEGKRIIELRNQNSDFVPVPEPKEKVDNSNEAVVRRAREILSDNQTSKDD